MTAPCLEKVYSYAGPEFGQREDSVLIIRKALYGLKSSSRAFGQYFAEFLRGCGFKPTRYDRDVWMRLRDTQDGDDYICTHVDDFKVVTQAIPLDESDSREICSQISGFTLLLLGE